MSTLFQFTPLPDTPIVCDFAGASDTPEERLAEYGRLFKAALIGRVRTDDGVILTFAPGEGVAEWVADLAAREAACCPFMSYDISATDGEIRWETSGAAVAQPILDEYYELYEAATQLTVEEQMTRYAEKGFEIRVPGR